MLGIEGAVDVRQMEVCGRSIRVATRPSTGSLPRGRHAANWNGPWPGWPTWASSVAASCTRPSGW